MHSPPDKAAALTSVGRVPPKCHMQPATAERVRARENGGRVEGAGGVEAEMKEGRVSFSSPLIAA